MFRAPLIAARQLQEHGGNLEPKEIHRLALLASDDPEFAAARWREAQGRKMMKE